MRFRPLLALLALTFLLAACGDDGGGSGDDAGALTTTAPTATQPATTGTVAGPTDGQVACTQLAERYVRKARVLFDREGTPRDELVERVRARLQGFDTIAATAGCGEEYVQGVCDGLDDLTAEGLLVIIPLTTAQCL